MGAVVVYGSAAGHRLFPAAAVSSPGRIAVLLILVAFGLAIYAARCIYSAWPGSRT